MASALYDSGRQKFLEGGLAWLTDTIKVLLIDTANYTVNLATHTSLADIPVGARVGTAQTLVSKTSAAGVADAADVTFTSLTGASIEAVVIYKDTGTESTSFLIAYIDTGTGIPFSPSGGNVTISWDNGANRIFKL
jgi:hypothetical protein